MITKSFDKENHKKDRRVIIYGASVWGELAFYGLKQMGILPDYFCDQSRKRKEYFGVKIISPKELETKFNNEEIIIASADFFYEIKEKLEELGCINLFDMSKILLQEFHQECLSNRARDMYANKKHYLDVVNNQGDKKLVLARLQYVVTECCTLRCRDCSYLMPYYNSPRNIDIDFYKPAFENFMNIIDYLAELRILGGEPLVNKDFYKLIIWYCENEKIGKISVFTNGTVIPEENALEAMKNKKVSVHISDYGVNRDGINVLINKLDEKEIKFFVRTYDEWQHPGNFEKRLNSTTELKDKFSNCFERSGYTFLKGKVYRCPRIAHAVNLRAIPDFGMDYVDFSEKGKSIDVLRTEFEILREKEYLEGCRFCDGADNHENGIPAGIQIDKFIPYEKKERDDRDEI